jgi:ferredoxin-thioredoxin reductase catalytic subunit
LIGDVGDFVRNAAGRNGWSVQPDEEFLNTVQLGLEKSRKMHGYYLCPCREGWGNRIKDRDITCPCEYAAQDIAEYGNCYCGLFVSEQMAASGLPPAAIPDRRPEELYPD